MIKLRTIIITGIVIGISTLTVNAQKKKQKPVKLETSQDSVSYAIGTLFGSSLHNYGFKDLNIKVFSRAIEDALLAQDTLMKPEQANELVQKAVTGMEKKKAEKNLTDGKAFLEKNKKEPGVVELPSGLQYKIIKEGSGESPKAESRVTVHYKGSLIDGKQFDSSYDRGEPAQFGVSDVIEGWKEALQLMKPGAKWMVYVPSTLAYGENSMQ
ncbi:MAG: FKBP-type peptidyl-prolyl cis-trans isomerase, partial [Bacteroidetes bacterium]|nr:FKBP-type peptidyl-prolyl cis-trans isomerase [Bacteroidota bacterium]